MATLYISEQGASIHKYGESLTIEKNGERLLEVEIHRLDAVLIFGNVQFSTQVIAQLLKNNIELALLSMNGRLRGQLTPPLPKNIHLRINQYKSAADQEFMILQAREIIRTKLENCCAVLKQASWRSANAQIKQTCVRIKRLKRSLSDTKTLDAINGVEGSAANAYFHAFPDLLKTGDLMFKSRSRRPPRDPVNALLSLGYSLLTTRLQSLLDAHGFDPYLGYLHRPDYGKPSLALDLIEPYRAPYIDKWVVRLFNPFLFIPFS